MYRGQKLEHCTSSNYKFIIQCAQVWIYAVSFVTYNKVVIKWQVGMLVPGSLRYCRSMGECVSLESSSKRKINKSFLNYKKIS